MVHGVGGGRSPSSLVPAHSTSGGGEGYGDRFVRIDELSGTGNGSSERSGSVDGHIRRGFGEGDGVSFESWFSGFKVEGLSIRKKGGGDGWSTSGIDEVSKLRESGSGIGDSHGYPSCSNGGIGVELVDGLVYSEGVSVVRSCGIYELAFGFDSGGGSRVSEVEDDGGRDESFDDSLVSTCEIDLIGDRSGGSCLGVGSIRCLGSDGVGVRGRGTEVEVRIRGSCGYGYREDGIPEGSVGREGSFRVA